MRICMYHLESSNGWCQHAANYRCYFYHLVNNCIKFRCNPFDHGLNRCQWSDFPSIVQYLLDSVGKQYPSSSLLNICQTMMWPHSYIPDTSEYCQMIHSLLIKTCFCRCQHNVYESEPVPYRVYVCKSFIK